MSRAAEQTAHPRVVPAGGRVITSIRCTRIDEQPKIGGAAMWDVARAAEMRAWESQSTRLCATSTTLTPLTTQPTSHW